MARSAWRARSGAGRRRRRRLTEAGRSAATMRRNAVGFRVRAGRRRADLLGTARRPTPSARSAVMRSPGAGSFRKGAFSERDSGRAAEPDNRLRARHDRRDARAFAPTGPRPGSPTCTGSSGRVRAPVKLSGALRYASRFGPAHWPEASAVSPGRATADRTAEAHGHSIGAPSRRSIGVVGRSSR